MFTLAALLNTSNSFDISGTRRKSLTLPQITEKFHFTFLWSHQQEKRSETPLLSHLFLPSIFPSIRIFSNELAFCIWWPKYWSFSFSIRPSNANSELIFFRIDWFDRLAVQGTLKSLFQHHSSKASILFFFSNEVKQLQWTKTVQSRFYMQGGSNGEIFNWHVSQICRFPFQITSSRVCL